jgi:hypothetical protein
MAFTCKRCGHLSSTKGNLIQHLHSKKECLVRNENITRDELIQTLQKKEYKTETTTCSSCKKTLSKSQIARHNKICPKREKVIQMTTQDLEELTQKIKNEVINEMKALGIGTMNTGTINNTTITNNTYNIQLNNFGNENTSYLTPEFLTFCVNNPKRGMSSLIEKIHYNKDYPENHNLRCKSLKSNVFERFVDTQWMLCDASNTLDELIRKGYKILESHISQQSSNDPDFFEDEDKVNAIQRFRIILTDKQKPEYHSVKRDLRLLVKEKTLYILELVETIDSNDET